MNEAVALYALVNELKRRRMFVSMMITNAGVKVSFWTGLRLDDGKPELKTETPETAWGYIKAMRENERNEMDWVGRRSGRTVG